MPRGASAVHALALLVALACGPEAGSEGGAAPAPFDGARAFTDLVDLVALGPRPAGSAGAESARGLIRDRLRQAGLRVELRPFEVSAPDGQRVPMTNIIGVLEGERPERVMLITHYDTKRIPGVRFVGANDGASGVALLLEVARQLALRPPRASVWLAFCDGEEAFGTAIDADDGLYGSRQLARELDEAGELERIGALLLVDMVADADLGLTEDLGSSARLRRLLLEVARARGLEDALGGGRLLVVDDHTPFMERGVASALALIDFQFGARRSPGPLWHTARDDLGAVSAESLNRVGTLVVELLERIDANLQ